MNDINHKIKKEIENITNDNDLGNNINKLLYIYSEMTSKNEEIEIIYNIYNDSKIKIFDNRFIKNNIYKCKIIYKNNEYDLCEYINDIDNSYNNKGNIKLKLKGINNITNMSYMFYECNSLSSLPNISNLDTSKVINMSHMFYECISLSPKPNIYQWNTSKLINKNNLFDDSNPIPSQTILLQNNQNNISNLTNIIIRHNQNNIKKYIENDEPFNNIIYNNLNTSFNIFPNNNINLNTSILKKNNDLKKNTSFCNNNIFDIISPNLDFTNNFQNNSIINNHTIINKFERKQYKIKNNYSVFANVKQASNFVDKKETNEIFVIVQQIYSFKLNNKSDDKCKYMSDMIAENIKYKLGGQWFVLISDSNKNIPFSFSSISASDALVITLGSTKFQIIRFK